MNKGIERIKIGIIGLGVGAGTGFITTCLAGELAEQGNYYPAVIELGSGGLYDSLGMDKHFSGRKFFPFHRKVVQDKSIWGRSNQLNGINWLLVPTEEDLISLDLYQKLRLVNNAQGDFILCRLNGLLGEELWRLLWEMDRVLVVIDPLPSKMIESYELLCALKVSELPIIYIVNKFNPGVNRKELLNYLKLKKLMFFPMIDQREIYGAEYMCKAIYDMPDAKKQLKKPVEDLIKEIFVIYQ
ncbi:MAG: hypothetical protein ACOX4P_02355 [Anaerovoracaceae bacterium]|jgi:hypothetical protein